MEQTDELIQRLAQHYPEAKTTLDWQTPFQLLVATVLSAQSTDKRVNLVTAPLFREYPDAASFARLSPEELEPRIRPCGLSKTKALHLVQTARILLEEYGGEVPQDLDSLMKLPGVGRKTADVVVSNAFGIPAIAVDTHVFRVSHRLGLAQSSTPLGTEKELMERVPRDNWTQFHHWLIYHGRAICKPIPLCSTCFLADLCPKIGVTKSR